MHHIICRMILCTYIIIHKRMCLSDTASRALEEQIHTKTASTGYNLLTVTYHLSIPELKWLVRETQEKRFRCTQEQRGIFQWESPYLKLTVNAKCLLYSWDPQLQAAQTNTSIGKSTGTLSVVTGIMIWHWGGINKRTTVTAVCLDSGTLSPRQIRIILSSMGL
jgi:hypothetical protein